MSTETTTSDTEIQYQILRKSGVPQGFECTECMAQGAGVDDVDHEGWCSKHD